MDSFYLYCNFMGQLNKVICFLKIAANQKQFWSPAVPSDWLDWFFLNNYNSKCMP